ncbi:MAG TPA: protease modulator HflC [Sedimentisphaerales bacterium]|nr:protease modulator HflC [Sedimentisphaerales bacterium]
MKSIAITVFIVLLIGVVGLYLISFQVRETESALVMTFNKPTREITEPGWYFKWPAPIQRVNKFDSRGQVVEGDLVETTTKGAVPIIVNTYVVWTISEPLQFYNSNERGSIEEARKRLRSQINDTQNRVIGLHEFAEFVNSDPSKIKMAQIESEMFADLRRAVRDAGYGIEIKTLGIKQLKISKDVSEDVFKRMRSERNRRTVAIIEDGNSVANRIRSEADAKKTELLAAAEARAKAIRGEGDAEAAKYYEMLQENPELAMFLRNTEALKETLKNKTTLVIPADVPPFDLLKGMPDIRVLEPNELKK